MDAVLLVQAFGLVCLKVVLIPVVPGAAAISSLALIQDEVQIQTPSRVSKD